MNKKAKFISYIEKEHNNHKVVFPICEFKHNGKVRRYVSDIEVDIDRYKANDDIIIEFTDNPNHYAIIGYKKINIIPYIILFIILFILIGMFYMDTKLESDAQYALLSKVILLEN